ncbi:MAG: bifunctional UDP-N-acetylmuramoyl-tripeptide:D-alanyl-D-alanine ligase/alanine racemase [Sediminibacterium sp.]
MSYSIEHIASWLNAKSVIKTPAQIDHLLTDSRRLIYPNTSLFFAITSPQNDGHIYIEELLQRGVFNFVVKQNFDTSRFSQANFLKVNDVLLALQIIVTNHRAQYTYPVIGITGSNGKTIVKEWLHQLLANRYNIIRSPRSYNSQIGVPLSVWEMSEKHQLGIFEAGISQKGEMERLAKIIQPSIGILTSIGTAHQEGFEDESEKRNEKWKLFHKAKVVIAPLEQVPFNQSNKNQNEDKQIILTWSRTQQATLQVQREEVIHGQTHLYGIYNGELVKFIIPFSDVISVNNTITCILTLLHLQESIDEIQLGIAQLRHLDMRMQIKKGMHECYILNDSYSNDLHSLQLALTYATQQAGGLPITLILSDFVQFEQNNFQYEKLINELLLFPIKKFIAIGPQLSKCLQQNNILQEKGVKQFCFESTQQFILQMDLNSFKEEFILIKGARIFELEKINDLLQLQVHKTMAEINLTALVNNFKKIKELIGPKVKVMAMVKAFGYGTGSVAVARILQFHHVDYLSVAYADEGVELRQAGIQVPIMVMNVDETTFDTLVKYHLEPEIFSLQLFQQFDQYIKQQAISNFPIHIKLNTGMNRLGFDLDIITKLCKILKTNSRLKVQSIFSHLSASGNKNFQNFTNQQLELFNKAALEIEEALGYKTIKHIANSDAILLHPMFHLDMVRLGIGLYGIGQGPIALEPVIQLTTTISQIRNLKKGDTVGYNRAGVLLRDSIIATVRLGYADGYSRQLGLGKGAMWVNGAFAPIVGDICMDMTMIDITDIPSVREGDSVQVFGKNLTITQVAQWAGTIPYEILTSIGPRVKRIYIAD